MRSRTESLRALWDAWSGGSVGRIVALLHPDVTWRSTLLGREYRGRDEVQAWLDALAREWKSLTVTLDSVEDAAPDAAVARGRVSGFDYGGGERVDLALTWVAEFEGDLVVRGLVFEDEADAARYLASRGRS
jgi:ketosteroid isomerase-like protein